MEIKEIINTKQFKNSLWQMDAVLKRRWFNVVFIQENDDLLFKIEKLCEEESIKA